MVLDYWYPLGCQTLVIFNVVGLEKKLYAIFSVFFSESKKLFQKIVFNRVKAL